MARKSPEQPRSIEPLAKHIPEFKKAVEILAREQAVIKMLTESAELIRHCDADRVESEVCGFLDDLYVETMGALQSALASLDVLVADDSENAKQRRQARDDLRALMIAGEDPAGMRDVYFSRADMKDATALGEYDTGVATAGLIRRRKHKQVRAKFKKGLEKQDEDRRNARIAYAEQVEAVGDSIDWDTIERNTQRVLRIAEMVATVQQVFDTAATQDNQPAVQSDNAAEVITLDDELAALTASQRVTRRQVIKARAVRTALGRYAKGQNTETQQKLGNVYDELCFSLDLEQQLEGVRQRIEDALQRMEEAVVDRSASVAGLGMLYNTLSQDGMPGSEQINGLKEAFYTLKIEYDRVRLLFADLLEKIQKGNGGDTGHHHEEMLEGIAMHLNEEGIDDTYLKEFFLHLAMLDERIQALSSRFGETQRAPRRLSAKREEQSVEDPTFSETGKPFKYDKAKAREYGRVEVELPPCPKAQELFDKIIANNLAFLGTDGTLNREEVQRYWDANCTDLPNIPDKSWRYIENLAAGLISDTIDGDSGKTPTKKHIPDFGKGEFFLVMGFLDFGRNDSLQKQAALSHPSMKILKPLFNKEDPTSIPREEINTALWEDHDNRIQSTKAKAIIAELLGSGISADDPEIDNYELTLIRQDQYARLPAGQAGLAQTKNYGKKNLWTHFDGYDIREDGKRNGLIGGDRGCGGAARVGTYWRGRRDASVAVRLVLQRKQLG